MSHTPGPWKAYNQIGSRILKSWLVASDSPNQPCGICRLDESLTGEQAVANAKLIAAAPDMLEALEDMVNARAAGYDLPWGTVNAAIAKAKGE